MTNNLNTLYQELSQFIPEPRLRQNEPLKNHTYIKIGGPADLFVQVNTTEELVNVYKNALNHQIPIFILGGGSNCIIDDAGVRGLVIKNRADKITLKHLQGDIKQRQLQVAGAILQVDSGVITNHLVRYSIDHGLKGLEFFLGVPGTVGGAIFNNSHYHNQLIGDRIQSVSVLRNGQVLNLAQPQLEFAYDYSVFHKTHDLILSAQFSLESGDKAKLWETATNFAKHRSQTQPLSLPNSGCIFKNLTPDQAQKQGLVPNLSIGKLIDDLGLKGTQIGNAMVSDKHANFIVNLGDATSKDVHELIRLLTVKIQKHYRITPVPEVFFIGPDITNLQTTNHG